MTNIDAPAHRNTPESRDLKRKGLAAFVSGRRHYLQLTQEEVRAKGGPSNATLTAIEGGIIRSMRFNRNTFEKLDVGLGLELGTTRRVAQGETVSVDITSIPRPEGVESLQLSDDDISAVLASVEDRILVEELDRRLAKVKQSLQRLEELESIISKLR